MTKPVPKVRDDAPDGPAIHFRSPVVTTCLVVIALCIGGYAFSYLKAVLSPLLIALFIFFLTNPLVRALQARNYSPSLSYFLVLMLTVVTFLGLGRVMYGSMQGIGEEIPKYQDNLGKVVDRISSPIVRTLEYLGVDVDTPETESADKPTKEPGEKAPEKTPESTKTTESDSEPASPGESPTTDEAEKTVVDAILPEAPEEETKTEEDELGQPFVNKEKAFLVDTLRRFLTEGWREFFNGVLGTSLEFLEIGLMTIFYLFFILMEAPKLPKRIKRGFAFESTQTLMEMGQRIQRSIEQYLRVKTGVSAGLGATTGLICLCFGLDFWLMWAGFMFLSNYVTYIGSMVALVPPIAIAFLQFDSTLAAVVLTVLLILNRFFWIDYAEIKLSGQQLNVSPIILLLSIALFGALWGVIGMVLAVPVVTSVKIALSQFESTQHLASLLSEE